METTTFFTVFIVHTDGGEGPQPNQGVKPNPTIHYIPYEIVEERTKEYLGIK